MSDMQDRDSIISKVKGLAAIANPESGAFPGEIANASAMMQRLMDKYQIAWAEVLLTQKEVAQHFDGIHTKTIIGSFKTWHWALGRVIARITGTKHYRTGAYGKTTRDPNGKDKQGKKMCFFGADVPAQTAADLFDTWVVSIDNMAKKATAVYIKQAEIENARDMRFYGVKQLRHLPNLGSDHPNIWRNSWLEGVVAGIGVSLDTQEKERSPETSTALMVISKEMMVAYSDFSHSFVSANSSGGGRTNFGAYTAGVAVGKTLNLSPKKMIGG